LLNFAGGDGANPVGGLIFDKHGALYGTTTDGGDGCSSGGCGSVFKLTPAKKGTYTESILYSFTNSPDGSEPYAGLIADGSGALYGTTAFGGATSNGAVFKLTPSPSGAYAESIIYSFQAPPDGTNPMAGLLAGPNGVFYGTTLFGGANGQGTVFRLSPSGSGSYAENIVHEFGSSGDGRQPYAGLVADATGELYGTTLTGGANSGNGTAFKVMPDGSDYSLAYTFASAKSGEQPIGGLLVTATGTLYGTTSIGGKSNDGTVFELVPTKSGYKEKVLHRFRGPDGAGPDDTLLMLHGGLYGTTSVKGTCSLGCGTVFELQP
jgi:uncharacterized repeat protein (TIGR03803 family)